MKVGALFAECGSLRSARRDADVAAACVEGGVGRTASCSDAAAADQTQIPNDRRESKLQAVAGDVDRTAIHIADDKIIRIQVEKLVA